MKPIPSTLETRRQAAIAGAVEGLANPKPYWHASVVPRLQAIVDCGPDASAEAIIAAQLKIGHMIDLTLTIGCNACGQEAERVVTVGQAEDCDSMTATLCRACLVEAIEALDAAP